jgi:flavin-dependent dehydrogenase
VRERFKHAHSVRPELGGHFDPHVEVYVLPQRRAIFAFATNDNLLSVLVAGPIDEFASVRSNLVASFTETLDFAPGFGERVRLGKRVERFYGSGDLPNYLRKPFGPGWALVGDAGCHKDPFLAFGICDALRDAELLAEAAHEGLSGSRPLDAALTEYEARRNEATLPDYYENLHRAQFCPIPPDVLRLRRALRDNPDDTTRYVMATERRIPREAFFDPENLARIMASAPERTTA